MPVHRIDPVIAGEVHPPFDCDQRVINALVTVGAFVALADGCVAAIERDAAVGYIIQRRLAPSISWQRIAECFDERARRLQDRDFAELLLGALRPVAGLSLATDLVRIAERVAAADRRIHVSETKVISLIRTIIGDFPEPKVVGSCPAWSMDQIGKMEPMVKDDSVKDDVKVHTWNADERRVDQLLDRLPKRVGSMVRFVRRPSARWLRLPMGVLLTFGGIVGFLPLVGFWMLPLGLALLADDVPLLRSLRSRILEWIEHYRPDWLSPGAHQR